MFRSTGLFDDLMCPDPSCDRRHCMFWHNSEPVQPQLEEHPPALPVSQYDPAYPLQYASQASVSGTSAAATAFEGYSSSFLGYTATVEGDAQLTCATTSSTSQYGEAMDATYGYTGYIDQSTSSGYSSATGLEHNPLLDYADNHNDVNFNKESLPAPIIHSAPSKEKILVKQEIADDDDFVMVIGEKTSKKKKPPADVPPDTTGMRSKTSNRIKSLPLPKVSNLAAPIVLTPKQEVLFECANNVAVIDAEIERLMKLRQEAALVSSAKKDSALPSTSTPSSSTVVSSKKIVVKAERAVSPEPDPSPPPPVPPIVKEAAAPVKPKTKTAAIPMIIGYTPTPLEDLKRQKEEERRKLEEKKALSKRRLTESEVANLFGEDSEEEYVPKKKKNKTLSTDSKAESSANEVKKSSKVVSSSKPKDAAPAYKPSPIVKAPPASSSVPSTSSSDKAKSSVSSRGVAAVAGRASTSRSSSSPERVEKGKGLTSEQMAAAKQRIARPAAGSIVRSVQSSATSRRLPSAAEQMHARMQAVAKEKEKKAKERAAEVVAAGTIKKKPLTMEQMYGQKRAGVVGSAPKGEGRAARVTPARANAMVSNPQLAEPTNSKVPLTVRLQYLQRIFEQLNEFLPRNEAVKQAEDEEKAILDKVKHRQGYMVAAVNTLKRLRDAAEGKQKSKPTPGVSHQRLLVGRAHNQITVGANGPKQSLPITEARLFEALEQNYLLSEEQLKINSYPRRCGDSRVQMEPSFYDKKKNKKAFVPDYVMDRICSRCAKEFVLCPKGSVQSATCIYHLKGKGRMPGRRTFESTHPCCGGDATVAGCQVANSHVCDTLRDSELSKFVEAPEPQGASDPRSKKVLAMDCEMVYTVWGPALARVTVVDVDENVVLDEMVKPDHAVVDYNTTFSGITANELETASCSLRMAQDRLFELMNRRSILVGHSLESDLKAMRIVHDRVVDTAILFPHRTENEKKRGLKELALDKLGISIQEDLGGHDSKEDSVTALLLAIHKAKFDGKI